MTLENNKFSPYLIVDMFLAMAKLNMVFIQSL